MVADIALLLLFITVAVGHAMRGPARSVKVLTAVLVMAFAMRMGLVVGVSAVVDVFTMVAVITTVSMAFALLLWREPARLRFMPASPDNCPAFAREDLEQSTTALRMLGFQHAGDFQSTWSLGGDQRTTFTRMFRDAGGTIHASMVVIARPRVKARQLQCLGADGVSRTTCNLQHNAELLHEPRTLVKRVPRATGWEAMLSTHRQWAAAGAVPCMDAEARAVELHDGWADRLVEEGVAAVRKGQLAARITRVPFLVARVLSAWFA